MRRLELMELQKAASAGVYLGNKDMEHLSNKMGIANYIRIADEIRNKLQAGKILDWGCGYGHMTYLLKNRGFLVSSFEVAERENLGKLQVFSRIDMVYGKENSALPFTDEMFDAVLSCGTLEHVSNTGYALNEIKRILKKNGKFFIYMLPNKFSFAEWLAEKRGISVHPLKYDKTLIREMLAKSGFRIARIKRGNVLPKNLTGLPSIIKKVYGGLYFILIPLDKFFAKIPLINWSCGVFEVIAEKM